MTKKYVSTLEVQKISGTSTQQLDMYIENGKSPTVGDFLTAIKEMLGFEPQIYALKPLEFRVGLTNNSDVRSIRVLRTMEDTTAVIKRVR